MTLIVILKAKIQAQIDWNPRTFLSKQAPTVHGSDSSSSLLSYAWAFAWDLAWAHTWAPSSAFSWALFKALF